MKNSNNGLTIDELQKRLQNDRFLLGSWEAVAKKWDAPKRTVYAIAEKGYEPKSLKIRIKYNLTAKALAPVCPVHGVVHVGRCPKSKTKRIQDCSMKELRWMIENRETVSG